MEIYRMNSFTVLQFYRSFRIHQTLAKAYAFAGFWLLTRGTLTQNIQVA